MSLERKLSMRAAAADRKKPYQLLLEEIESYLKGLSQTQGIVLRRVGKQISDSVMVFQGEREPFRADMQIFEQQKAYGELKINDERDFEERLKIHQAGIDKLKRDIAAIDEERAQITGDRLVGSLKTLNVYQDLHNQIIEKLNQKRSAVDALSCWLKLFCCSSSDVEKINTKILLLEQQRKNLESDNEDVFREQLLDKLKNDRIKKSAELDKLIANPPSLNDANRVSYLKASALLAADMDEYYCQLDNASMLHCLRFYVLLQYQSSNEINEKTPLINRGVDHTIMQKLKSRLAKFYCRDPGKCDFNYYLKKFNDLEDKRDKDLILSGGAELDLLRRVFPFYPQARAGAALARG